MRFFIRNCVYLRAFFLILTLLQCSNIVFAKTNINLITEDFPPLNYLENNELKGPAVEIVQLIKKKLALTGEIKVLPWKRGYGIVETTENSALFSTTRTDKREHEFKWVGPLAVKNYGFYAKKSSAFSIQTLDDAKKYKVGGQLGGASEDYLLSNGFKQVQLVIKPAQNFKKLASDHIDLWYTSATTLIGLGKIQGIDRKDYKMVYVTKQSALYLAFNKMTSNDVISDWQNAYDEIYSSGKMKAIFKKHGLEDLFPAKHPAN